MVVVVVVVVVVAAVVDVCPAFALDLDRVLKIVFVRGLSTGSMGFSTAAGEFVDGSLLRPANEDAGGRRFLASSFSIFCSTLFSPSSIGDSNLFFDTDSNKDSSGRLGMSSSSGVVFSFRVRPGPKILNRLGFVPGFRSSWLGRGLRSGTKTGTSMGCSCCCSCCCWTSSTWLIFFTSSSCLSWLSSSASSSMSTMFGLVRKSRDAVSSKLLDFSSKFSEVEDSALLPSPDSL